LGFTKRKVGGKREFLNYLGIEGEERNLGVGFLRNFKGRIFIFPIIPLGGPKEGY